MLCGTLWRNVDVLWRNVDVMWRNVDVLWMLYGTLRRIVDVLWRNVDVMWTLHISIFHNLTKSSPLLSSPWSVILKYAIVGVMWIHQISTLTIKWTTDSFLGYTVQCICYQSLGLVSGVSTVPEL